MQHRGPTQSARPRRIPLNFRTNKKSTKPSNVSIRKFNRHQAYMQCGTLFKLMMVQCRVRHRERWGRTQRAPGPTESAGDRHRDRRGPTQRAPGPDTESAGSRHRERRGPTQRAPGPDTESAGARHRDRRDLTQSAGSRHRERRSPTQTAGFPHKELILTQLSNALFGKLNHYAILSSYLNSAQCRRNWVSQQTTLNEIIQHFNARIESVSRRHVKSFLKEYKAAPHFFEPN